MVSDEFSRSVPTDLTELDLYLREGWTLKAPSDGPVRPEPPSELARLMGFRKFVHDIEEGAVLRAQRDSLDAAWAGAEAALPEDAGLTVLREQSGSYRAWATSSGSADGISWANMPQHEGLGDTPADALRALAANLRAKGS